MINWDVTHPEKEIRSKTSFFLKMIPGCQIYDLNLPS